MTKIVDLETLPKSRIEAIRSGYAYFFTGMECKRGHRDYRVTVSGSCRECLRLNSSKWASEQKITPSERIAIRRATLSDGERSSIRKARREVRAESIYANPQSRWAYDATSAAKQRAKKKGVPFGITKEYVKSLCVEICPALGVKLIYCNPKKIASNSAQLDRIIPELGYVVGNVRVISKRANVVRNDAYTEEIGRIYQWLLLQECPDNH